MVLTVVLAGSVIARFQMVDVGVPGGAPPPTGRTAGTAVETFATNADARKTRGLNPLKGATQAGNTVAALPPGTYAFVQPPAGLTFPLTSAKVSALRTAGAPLEVQVDKKGAASVVGWASPDQARLLATEGATRPVSVQLSADSERPASAVTVAIPVDRIESISPEPGVTDSARFLTRVVPERVPAAKRRAR